MRKLHKTKWINHSIWRFWIWQLFFLVRWKTTRFCYIITRGTNVEGDFDGIPEVHAKCYQTSERRSYYHVLIVHPVRINLDTLTNYGPEENKCRILAHAVLPNIYQNRTWNLDRLLVKTNTYYRMEAEVGMSQEDDRVNGFVKEGKEVLHLHHGNYHGWTIMSA